MPSEAQLHKPGCNFLRIALEISIVRIRPRPKPRVIPDTPAFLKTHDPTKAQR